MDGIKKSLRVKKPKIAIITSFPRHQRVEVYNEMAKDNEINFCVFYLRKLPYGRNWEYGPKIEHNAIFIPELRIYRHFYLSPGFLKKFIKYNPDLMIMTQYATLGMQMLMYLESIRKKPWIFWSEIPYVQYAENPIIHNEYLRKYLRKLFLLPVKYFPKEIWGVGARAVKEYQKIARDRIVVKNLPYFANLDRFFLAAKSRQSASCVRFLFSGSLSLRKGADVVAKAIKLLSDQGLNFEIHIAGKGPLEKEFKNLPDSVWKHIHWYGFLQLNDIPKVYSQTDVLLFPSRHDGWGMTLGEGMAAGMPVISTSYTGAAVDMLKDGYNGFLLSKITAKHLADTMCKFITNPKLIKKMGYQALKTSEKYTYKIGAHTFLNMIKNALDTYL